MARVALTALLAVHGALHALGFLRWSRLAPLPQLTGRTLFALSPAGERLFAVLWLAAAVLLVGAAALRLVRHDGWWIPAILGALLSQLLVVVSWHDAKVGTVANVLILAAAIGAAGHARLQGRIDAEIRALLARFSSARPSVVQRAALQNLPEPVRAWLERSRVVGRERVRTVRLKQRGDIRMKPGSSWLPVEAEQYFSVDEPAFVWRVETRMMGVVPISGRDRYAAGKGEMLIKAAWLVTVANAAGEGTAQSAMLRFLAEIVWFPSAALSPYVRWEAVDATSARATMSHGGIVASAVFTFADDGRVLGLRAERFMDDGGEARRMPWIVSCSEWRTIRGTEIPVRGDVAWKLEGGDFPYYRWEIADIDYDRAEPYARRP